MPAALPLVEIGILLVALLAIAVAQQINNIMRAVGQLVSDVWLIGSTLAAGVDAVARGIAYVLGKAEAGVDAAIGASWHALARLMDDLWKQVEGFALGYLQLAETVLKHAYALSGIRAIVNRAETLVHGIEHGVKTVQRELHGIDAEVKRLTRDLTKGIGHDLRIGLRDLRKEVRGIDHQVTTTIPKAIDYAEGQTASLRDFIKAIPGTKYLDWVGGIVAAGLAAIGMEWLICRSRSNVNGKTGCDIWNEIESLLGVAIVAGLSLDLPALIEEAQKTTPGIIDGIEKLAGLKS